MITHRLAMVMLFSIFLSCSINAQNFIDFDDLEAPTSFAEQTVSTDAYSDDVVRFDGSWKVLQCLPETGGGFAITGFSAPHALKWNTPNITDTLQRILFNVPVDNPSFKIGAPSVFFSEVIIHVLAMDATGNILYDNHINVADTSLVAVSIDATLVSEISISVPVGTGGCLDDVSYTVSETSICSDNFIADTGEDRKVYIGYRRMRTAELTVDYSGGAGGETILWSTGETTESIHVCPNATTIYTVTITDSNGCEAIDEVAVKVEDTRCGWRGRGIIMCYRGWNYCVPKRFVRVFQYYYGASIGRCDNGNARRVMDDADKPEVDFEDMEQYLTDEDDIEVHVFPNPTSDYLNIDPGAAIDESIGFSIYNASGQEVFHKTVETAVIEQIDVRAFEPGIYLLRIYNEDKVLNQRKFVVQ